MLRRDCAVWGGLWRPQRGYPHQGAEWAGNVNVTLGRGVRGKRRVDTPLVSIMYPRVPPRSRADSFQPRTRSFASDIAFQI